MCAGKNRLVQVAKTGTRKLFDGKRKETFLEWFAATCNVRLSAARAGVHEKTIYKHLLKDPAFEEAFGRALRLGYVRLEARSLQEAHSPHPSAPRIESGALPPAAESDHLGDGPLSGAPAASRGEGLGEDYEIRVGLDDRLVEEHFDPQLALQLLREHRRHLPGSPDKRKAQRTTAQSASNEEIVAALTKRLKAFAIRVSKEGAPPPADAASGEGE